MTLTIAEIFDQAGEKIRTTRFKDVATFTPGVGSPVEDVQVSLTLAIEDQPGTLDAQVWGTDATIEYYLDDVGSEADEGDVFTIDGTDYTVTRVLQNDGRFVKVAVV